MVNIISSQSRLIIVHAAGAHLVLSNSLIQIRGVSTGRIEVVHYNHLQQYRSRKSINSTGIKKESLSNSLSFH
jgi:hypothetical protein